MWGKSPDFSGPALLPWEKTDMKLPYPILILGLTVTLSGCLVIEKPHTRLAPGPWRGVLQLDPSQSSRLGGSTDQLKRGGITFEEVTAGELPFLFDVVYIEEDSFHILIHNGEEVIEVTDIRYGLDRATAKDTLVIDFPVMDSYIEAVTEGGVIQGHWIVRYRDNYRIPFVARHGKSDRFTLLRKAPATDLSGEWAAVFSPGEADSYPAIAEFRQEGNHLTGTFRTETGDYRFLEGTVQADKFYLSCFDGSHAYLFEGKILENGRLQGLFRSGSHHLAYWEAQRDPAARLADPDTLTRSTVGDQPVTFRFKGTDGNWVSNHDPAFAGRPLVVQILGTWCPNCLDESRFLAEYIRSHPDAGIEVIGIAFERYRDETKALAALARYEQRLDLPYPILLGGVSDKKEAVTHVPFLEHIKAYPTTIFLDKSHRIVRIHTGFDGPATRTHEAFKLDFHNFVQRLAPR